MGMILGAKLVESKIISLDDFLKELPDWIKLIILCASVMRIIPRSELKAITIQLLLLINI
ncbi:MAG TPA: hypothetical protein VK136_05455 [Bacillota bacterium]|nr:hypothetical protein [Bacillota bacterium]